MKRLRLTEKELHVSRYYDSAKRRAIKHNIPFNITIEYLRNIATDFCPIFYTPFHWGKSGLGRGKMKPNGPQLDRIIPELGYVIGNVAFISHRANRIKDNGTMQEHYDIADWIWNQIHANKKSTTPVSTRTHQQSEVYPKLGPLSSAGIREDSNNTDDYLGAVQGENTYHRAKTGSGDSVGSGSQEMEPFTTITRLKDNGVAEPEIVRLDFGSGHISDKP